MNDTDRESILVTIENIQKLSKFNIVYLGTPYSKYKNLREAAERAAMMAAILRNNGINVYSPIVHSHALCDTGLIDPLSHEFWIKANQGMMTSTDAFIIGQMPDWQKSRGLIIEYNYFKKVNAPIFTASEDCLNISVVSKDRSVCFHVD